MVIKTAAAKKRTIKSQAPKPGAKTQKITKDMMLGEAVSKYPKTIEVLFGYGLH